MPFVMKKEYVPKPIDTSDIVLPKSLDGLIEEMAKNVHETWAQERICQGWRYGERRDDKEKLHPCLVAYEELPEEEKIFDRKTSLATLKIILKLGFQIHEK